MAINRLFSSAVYLLGNTFGTITDDRQPTFPTRTRLHRVPYTQRDTIGVVRCRRIYVAWLGGWVLRQRRHDRT